jgi:plastocyanin
VVLTAIILSSCSSPASPAQTSSPTALSQPTASGDAVMVANFAFSPASITVKRGTTVTWTNQDGTGHTVTSDNGLFQATLAPKATFSYTFKDAGTFSYHCSIHSFMKGTVIVQ